jgi:signal transduction histidine kinase
VVALDAADLPAGADPSDIPAWDAAARRLGAERVILARPVVPDWSLSAGRLEPRDQLYRRLLGAPELTTGVVDTSLLGDSGRRLRAAGVRAVMVVDGPEPGTLLIAENPKPGARGGSGATLVSALPGAPLRSGPEVVAAWVAELATLPAQAMVSPAGATSLARAAQVDLVVLLWPGPDGAEACWGGADCGHASLPSIPWPPSPDDPDALAELDGLTARPPVSPWRLVPARRGQLVVALSPPPADLDAVEVCADLLAFDAERARLSPEGRQQSLLAERVRIAGLVHDGVTQQVSNVLIQLQLLELAAEDPVRLRETLDAARAATAAALEELRASIYELAPRPSAMGDLVPSLRDWCRDYTAQWGIRVTVDVEGEARQLPPDTSMLAYAVVQEGLTNVRKHALAESAAVRVRFAPDRLTIEVGDDGHGFVEAAPEPNGSGRRMGLRLLRDRIRSAGGTLDVVSRPGDGAEVAVRLPL